MNQEQLTGTTDEFFNDICHKATSLGCPMISPRRPIEAALVVTPI
jgi:hypothetical protein